MEEKVCNVLEGLKEVFNSGFYRRRGEKVFVYYFFVLLNFIFRVYVCFGCFVRLKYKYGEIFELN